MRHFAKVLVQLPILPTIISALRLPKTSPICAADRKEDNPNPSLNPGLPQYGPSRPAFSTSPAHRTDLDRRMDARFALEILNQHGHLMAFL
jgi:hypothetical protein